LDPELEGCSGWDPKVFIQIRVVTGWWFGGLFFHILGIS
jgi:hypothetical protein